MFGGLPRLVAGHRLPGLEADPDPALLGQAAPIQKSGGRRPSIGLVAASLTPLALGLFVASLGFLARGAWKAGSAGGRAAAVGLSISTAAILSAFVVNRNIFNSDNYRYLVLLLIPWALGFGLAAGSLSRLAPVLTMPRTMTWAPVSRFQLVSTESWLLVRL